ncbi:hypothetical protein [Nonomuraea diastatica]|uniref:hypothetical protein n=1 Tax=Nonomuraea diastatica TaxID=1848329 RepID=UPI00140739D9|nr:hypothetical protein [Nonomuraea diastatica]
MAAQLDEGGCSEMLLGDGVGEAEEDALAQADDKCAQRRGQASRLPWGAARPTTDR